MGEWLHPRVKQESDLLSGKSAHKQDFGTVKLARPGWSVVLARCDILGKQALSESTVPSGPLRVGGIVGTDLGQGRIPDSRHRGSVPGLDI